MLRFFSDEYDEVCSTVIPSLTDLLTLFRKQVKAKGGLPQHYASMLSPILDAIIAKMRYDDAVDGGEEGEETDEAEFQELRKKLYVLQQTVAAVDEQLYIETLSRLVAETFGKFDADRRSINWRDLDVALHEMHLFGELAVRNGGLYAKRAPSSVASQRLIEMMVKMVNSDIASYPHPKIQLQYMEICVRYCQFFEQHTELITKVLENFVRLTHIDNTKVRLRSWYLFQRFVKPLKAHLADVAQTVIQATGDLLRITAEIPEDKSDDDEMSSEEADQSSDAVFNSQLYLFEAVGCIASIPSIPVENKIFYAQSIMNPIFADMQQYLNNAKNNDERAILQLHHDIMAIGTLARGFTDWMPGAHSGAPPP
ncbi:pre-tRNA nuclear export protein, partial [Coniosporium uncinatum]